MSIVIDETTRVVVQGVTGRMATFHTEEMVEYGTNVVAGTSPGKGGTEQAGLPVFDTVKNAVAETGAQASIACTTDRPIRRRSASISMTFTMTRSPGTTI